MELRHLRYFVTVAEEAHVTRAARRLGIQQPPLSQQLRALEREIGVQLFRRHPRGVDLTDAGRAFLVDARTILGLVDRAASTARYAAQGKTGQIAVGFTGSASFHPFVPGTVRAFRRAFPDVALTLEESGTEDLVQALLSERIDVAFIRSPITGTPELSVESLLEEEMIVALPTGHRLARKGGPEQTALSLKTLATEAFVLYRRASGPALYDAIIAGCRRAGFSPTVAQEAPLMVSTLNLVAAGLGVSIVPASLRRQHMEGVTYRRIKDRLRPVAPLNLAYRKQDTSAAAQRFVDLALRLRHRSTIQAGDRRI